MTLYYIRLYYNKLTNEVRFILLGFCAVIKSTNWRTTLKLESGLWLWLVRVRVIVRVSKS